MIGAVLPWSFFFVFPFLGCVRSNSCNVIPFLYRCYFFLNIICNHFDPNGTDRKDYLLRQELPQSENSCEILTLHSLNLSQKMCRGKFRALSSFIRRKPTSKGGRRKGDGKKKVTTMWDKRHDNLQHLTISVFPLT